MNSVELLYGERKAEEIPTRRVKIDKDRSPLTIEDVNILYMLYEIPMQKSMAIIPTSLHPSVPAIIGITFLQAKDGALGKFSMAFVGVACRTGIKPRHFITSAFCNSEKSTDFFVNEYGFPSKLASVELNESYDEINGSVTLNEAPILDVSVYGCTPLVGTGALIKYSPALNPILLDMPALLQFEAAYEFKTVMRGQCRKRVFAKELLTANMVTPTHKIAGSYATVDLHLMPVRFRLDMSIPAEQGGAEKI